MPCQLVVVVRDEESNSTDCIPPLQVDGCGVSVSRTWAKCPHYVYKDDVSRFEGNRSGLWLAMSALKGDQAIN